MTHTDEEDLRRFKIDHAIKCKESGVSFFVYAREFNNCAETYVNYIDTDLTFDDLLDNEKDELYMFIPALDFS